MCLLYMRLFIHTMSFFSVGRRGVCVLLGHRPDTGHSYDVVRLNNFHAYGKCKQNETFLANIICK